MMMMMTDDKNFNLLQVARMYEENIKTMQMPRV